jgi:hypothetical protein
VASGAAARTGLRGLGREHGGARRASPRRPAANLGGARRARAV